MNSPTNHKAADDAEVSNLERAKHDLDQARNDLEKAELELDRAERELECAEHDVADHKEKPHTVNIFVNEQPVPMLDRRTTGAKIKAAAISYDVHIQPNFILQEELANGTSRIVGDGDEVHLHDGLRFTALAPDDNS